MTLIMSINEVKKSECQAICVTCSVVEGLGLEDHIELVLDGLQLPQQLPLLGLQALYRLIVRLRGLLALAQVEEVQTVYVDRVLQIAC